jgi:UDP:flavonoid glycosyltransferase YjiC (YdhE family)
MLLLARALQAHGHQATLIAPPDTRQWAVLDVPFVPFGASVRQFVETAPDPVVHPLRATSVLQKFLLAETRRQLTDLAPHLRGMDRVLAATFAFGVPTACEAANAEYRFVAFCPQIFPSSAHPHVAVRSQTWPPWFNRLTWRLFSMLAASITRVVNTARAVPIADAVTEMLGQRAVLLSDPELAPLPGDVAVRVDHGGALTESPGSLPVDLQDYLAAGPAPVYVGFGSMTADDARGTAAIVVGACRRAGVRLVLSRGWCDLAAEDAFTIGPVSHPALFQRVAAVVHHGGAGTTAVAARAGVPQIIVPHMTDQFYWAHQVWQRGLSPPPIWRRDLNAVRLGEALVRAPEHAAEARAMAARLGDRADAAVRAATA